MRSKLFRLAGTLVLAGLFMSACSIKNPLAFNRAMKEKASSSGSAGQKNAIKVDFYTVTYYNSPSFNFTSQQVNGTTHIATRLENKIDMTGAPVRNLMLNFYAGIELGTYLSEEGLVLQQHPDYRWDFGDQAEDINADEYPVEAYVESGKSTPDPFTPPFDAKVEFSQTDLPASPVVQEVKVTIVPKSELDSAEISIDLAPMASNEGIYFQELEAGQQRGENGEVITRSEDSYSAYITHLPLKINQPYTFSFKVLVASNYRIAYTPWITIMYESTEEDPTSEEGTVNGNSLSYNAGQPGTWTWSADGNYDWEYTGSRKSHYYYINFGQYILNNN